MGLLSTLLLVGALNGLLLAALLAALPRNRAANRALALLLALVSVRLGIYIIGFAGGYDDHPWLTFLPLDLSFAFGPLLWLYVVELTTGGRPARWRLHFLPAALQFAYYCACFALPMPLKWHYYAHPHLDWVEPATTPLILFSTLVYLALAWRRYGAYQAWLDDHFGNREEWRLGWLRLMLAAFGAMTGLTAGFVLWSVMIAPLDYFGRLPVMLAFCIMAYVLGLLGWHYGGIAYPHPAQAAAAEPLPEPRRDYAALADGWHSRVAASTWWRDGELTLAQLAGHLAVSERTLSRGLREGLEENFNGFVNRLRVEAVQTALRDPLERRDLLAIALDCGFNSKASFNRAFKAVAGQTPSAWRRARRKGREIRQSSFPADSEAIPAAD